MTKNLIALIGVSILISGCAVPSIGNRPTADFYPSEGLEKPIHSQKGRVETVTVEIAKEHERTGAINLDDWIGAQFIFENVSGKWADILIPNFKRDLEKTLIKELDGSQNPTYLVYAKILRIDGSGLVDIQTSTEIQYQFININSKNKQTRAINSVGVCTTSEYFQGLYRQECSRLKSVKNNLLKLIDDLREKPLAEIGQ